MRSSVAGSKGSTQWKRAVRPSSRSGMLGRARTSGGGDEGRVDESAHVPNRLTLFGPRSRLRRRGGGSLRLRDDGVTLVATTAGRGLLRRGDALRLRLGRDLAAIRRLRGGTRRLGHGGRGALAGGVVSAAS